MRDYITVSIQVTEAKGIWEQGIKMTAFIWETKLNKKQVRQPHARFKSFALILWTENQIISGALCIGAEREEKLCEWPFTLQVL